MACFSHGSEAKGGSRAAEIGPWLIRTADARPPRWLDRARITFVARSAATWHAAGGAPMGLLDKTKEKAIEFKRGQGGMLADAGIAKARETLALLNDAMPLLKQAGCSPSGVDIDIGLPPKLVANFATSDVSDEVIARITAENPDKKLACAILKALQQGARWQKAVEVGDMRASTMAIENSLLPCIKLSFVAG
ncbi:MAG TPA: hypothetical protein VLT58_09015 [Polyangia bacterium]|nr:hypothetical protein [Polyangia bacterium]